MSVLPVYRTQIPTSSPLCESSSSEFCASSGGHEREAVEQASSRLAARLERSEYKRSRGKRLNKQSSSSSLLGKTRLSDDKSKKKPSAPGKLYVSLAENGSDEYIKQDWESQEEPFFQTCYSQAQNIIKDSDEGHNLQSDFQVRPKSWYGSSQSPRLSFARYKARPVSMQEFSSDKGLSETNTSKIDSIGTRVSVYPAEPFKSHSLPHNYSESSKLSFRNEHLATSMSRSLSSSVSSYVGSVEEQDGEHHGVYSAYDVASRSPYSSLVHRHFSQSSLSSSSASWNHSNPSLGHLTPKTSRESINQSSLHGKTSETLDHWDRKSFSELPPVSETGTHQLNNYANTGIKHEKSIVNPQEQNFSSTCTIHLSKISTSAAPVLEQSNTSSVTNNHLSPEPNCSQSQLHPSNVTSHITEKRIYHEYSGEMHNEDNQVESFSKLSPEDAIFQSESHAGLGENSESPSQDLPVSHGSYSEGILSQSNEHQRHKNQESQNVLLMHASSTVPESYQMSPKISTPSVKDLARRFSGFLGEEGPGDMRKVKAETWPKLVLVHSASYHENEMKKYTVHSENSLSLDPVSMSKGTNSNSESRNRHKINLVNTDERQNFTVINADRSDSQHFELKENNGVTSKSKTVVDKEKLPKAVPLQSSDVKETEESIISPNVVYRRSELRNRVEGRQPQKGVPRPKSFPVVSRNESRSDTSHSTQDSVNSEGISHRLSLQELIRLHEDRIATHAQSARASSHTQIYLKRPVSDLFSIKSSEKAEQSSGVNDQQRVTLCNHEHNERAAKHNEDFPQNGEVRSSPMEIQEVEPTSSSQIKVIELSDKSKVTSDVIRTKDISARVKRHRTIGIVGVRQHIDNVSKPKRHTAIGIVSPKGTQPNSINLKHPVDEEVLIERTTCNDVELPEVQGTMEDLAEPTKNKKDLEKDKPAEFIDQTEYHKMDDEDEVDRLRTEERKGPDNEAHEMLLLPLISQESQHKKQGKFVPGVSQSAQDIVIKPTSQYVTLSSQYNTVTSSSQNKEEERNIYEDSSRDESTIFGSTKTQPEQDVTVDKPKHLPLDKQTPNTKTDESNNSFVFPKAYSSTKSIPVAQVSPVSPIFPSQQIGVPLSENLMGRSPLSTPSSAQEMYETRLALLNLVPSRSSHTPLEMQGSRMPDNNFTISTPFFEQRQRRNEVSTTSVNIGEARVDSRTEGLYLQLIDQLRRENHELREKFDLEKREWRQKYEEQKKVANAYQKLEDRYRRRVHELQDALSNCSCQSFMVTKDSSILVATTGIEKLNERGKLHNNSGLRIINQLEEWITEQSHNSKTDIVGASHDSLISSSTDMTGIGWDYAYNMQSGNPNQIDHVNGTHV